MTVYASKLGKNIPPERPCGHCKNEIRPARYATAGKTTWVDAAPVPDQMEFPMEGLVSYDQKGVAVLHSMMELRRFFPVPAFRLHNCPQPG